MPAPHEPLKDLLLGMAAERSLDALLAHITAGLARQPAVALARVWLLAPGDICSGCPERPPCAGRVDCLQLVASAGTPRDPAADWSRIDGRFRRVPVGERKIGRLVVAGPMAIADIRRDTTWIADPEWAAAEQIVGFGGVPLAFRGETLGALGVFMRARCDDETLDWLRLIGDHAAAALANARAFERIEVLKQRVEVENAHLRMRIAAEALDELIGGSAPMHQLRSAIETVAPTDVTVLVTGESGVGKELVARAVHRLSDRRERSLVTVNCASVPEHLFESEFFGHVRGAFTGAHKDRAGRFSLADGGTLFLDEVAEIPLTMQSKLLRVLQEGELERVGEEKTRHVDVRIIAATNRDLDREVAEGRFRADLYYRLSVFPLEVPPLRARRDDIPLLAEHFIARAAQRLERSPRRLDAEAIRVLSSHDWPGNVRELQNAVERALIARGDGPLRFELSSPRRVAIAQHDAATEEPVLTSGALKRLERDNLLRALRRSGGRVYGEGGAAALLEMHPSTLASRMKKLGIAK